MTYNKMKIGVGVFILLFLLNSVFIITYILIEKGVFNKRYNYYFKTFSAESFSVGMPIKVSGFKIGYIETIDLLDNGKVLMSFSVDEKNRKWVCDESVLVITKPLLGSPILVLYSAIGNPLMKENSTLEVYENNDINDLIHSLAPIMTKIENIVTSVDKITNYLAKDDSEVIKIVRNLEKFSAELAKNKSLLTTVTGDQNSTDALIKTINKLPNMIENFNKLSSDVNKEIMPSFADFIKQLGNIAEDIKLKLGKLDGVVNSVGSYDNEIDGLKEEIKTAVSKSNEIINKVDNLLGGEKNEKVILP